MMKKYFYLFLLALLWGREAVHAQLPASLEARLQAVLDSVCNRYRIKGTSAAVLYPGAGIWQGTHGISHEGAPVEGDMLLGMGSNTKTFISALMLKLQENGLLSLDDTIGRWVQGNPHISGRITIRQCLNHTSGLYDYLQNSDINDTVFGRPEKIWTMDELLALIRAPYFAPGTSWKYSNTNYVVAGIIIEKVTEKTYRQAMREYILDPAGLNNTFFYEEVSASGRLPHQWSLSMEGNRMTDLNEMPVNLIPQLFSMATTAGAMVCTASDNVRFWSMLTNGKIISDSSFREMTTMVNIGGAGYGLGIFRYNNALNGRSFYSHGGTFFGFINENLADLRSGVCISVFTNQDSISNNRILGSVIGALHKVTIQVPVGLAEKHRSGISASIYPNPASGVLHIAAGNGSAIPEVKVFDLNGRQYNCPVTALGMVDVSGLSPGLYLIHLLNEQKEAVYMQKVMITR